MRDKFIDDIVMEKVPGSAYADVSLACSIANALLSSEDFLAAIKSYPAFDLSSDGIDAVTGKEIAGYIEHYDGPNFCIRVFWPRWRWSKVLGRVRSSKPRTIELNARRLRRPIPSLVNTIVHEFIHCLDHWQTDANFGHGGNSSKGKHETAPYYIGGLAESMAPRYLIGSLCR